MRWHVFVTLVQKECLRHWASRGSILAVVLTVTAAALLTCGKGAGFLADRVERCYVDYWQDGPWISHLRHNIPSELGARVCFRPVQSFAAAGEQILYPPRCGAIQIRGGGCGIEGCKIWIWHPGTDAAVLAPFETWFWQETACFFREHGHRGLESTGEEPSGTIPALEIERSSLSGGVDAHAPATTVLVLFALFFSCLYLLPTWVAEERERGLALAMALSPASALEILTARSCFYAALGIGLAVLATGLSLPAALGQGLFWFTVAVAVLGALGIGNCLASLAGTQRTASMAALGYTLAVALLLAGLSRVDLPLLSWLALESHVPPMVQMALSGTTDGLFWEHAGAAIVLATGWIVLGVQLFRRRGWQ